MLIWQNEFTRCVAFKKGQVKNNQYKKQEESESRF